MKKLLLVIMVLTMVVSTFSVFAEEPLEMSDIPNMTAPGVLPIVVEREKISIGILQDPLVTDYIDNALTKRIAEETNIDVEFVFFPPTGMRLRKS